MLVRPEMTQSVAVAARAASILLTCTIMSGQTPASTISSSELAGEVLRVRVINTIVNFCTKTVAWCEASQQEGGDPGAHAYAPPTSRTPTNEDLEAVFTTTSG